MEQNIGILLCVCTCLLCVIEVFLFGYSIYKKSIVGIIIHILGICVSALISVFLIAYMQNKILSFETNKIVFATVIAAFVFAVAVSIKSLFRDAEPTISERIKEKRKKLKEITEEKNNNVKNEETEVDSKDDNNLKESNKNEDNKVSSVNKESKEEASKKDNEYNNSYDESDKMTMVKRSQKGRRNKKKSSNKKPE